jgi:thiamine transport system ATP-binding protein
MLCVDGLTFSYTDQDFCFDLEARRGEILGVIGPSGSGKSTLLHLIGGFIEPSSGGIRVDGSDITTLPPKTRPVTTVFQEHNLFPHLNVFDNVALGLAPSLKLDASARQRIHAALERVHLDSLATRRPAELSGGQRQRVTLARVMVRERPVLLLDEPLTALGPALRRELLELLRDLVLDQNLAAILVSHHPEDCALVAPRTAFVNDGRIHLLADTKALLADHDDPLLREYLGNAD